MGWHRPTGQQANRQIIHEESDHGSRIGVVNRNTGRMQRAGAIDAAASAGAGRRQGGRRNLQAKSARFAPTDLTADITALPANEREALAHMVRAAQVMDALFLEQVWAGNESMLYTLIKDESPLGKARLHEFLINKGPWARLDHNAVFIPGAPEKPPSANYYPEGATKAEVEKWINSLGGAEKAQRDRLLHDDSPRSRRPVHRRAVQHRVPGRAGHCRAAPARRGRGDRAADAEGVSRIARRGVRRRTTTTTAT